MPGKIALNPLPPGTKQPGLAQSLLYSGSRFQGHQKSKGNRYDVEVVLKVSSREASRNSKKIPAVYEPLLFSGFKILLRQPNEYCLSYVPFLARRPRKGVSLWLSENKGSNRCKLNFCVHCV